MHKLKPINVALNGRFSGVTQPTGTQTVAFHLFDAIIRSPREITITAFADTRFPGIEEWATTPNTRVIHVPFRDWSRAKSQLWEQFLFSSLAKKHGCHLLHYPITTCSRWFQSLPSIVTVHDLNFHTHPEWFATPFRLWMKYAAIPGIRRSTRIVTVSDYVLKEVQQHLSIPTEKLTRIYNGVKPFPPLSPTSTADTPPYLLCVGSLQPHKNLRRLIEAFFIAKKHQPDLQLHIVGRPQKGFNDVIEKDAYRTQKDIHFLGYLDEETLARTYQNARVFCYPSLEEGFGLPVLEAMAMHTTVVTSNASCLPEIAAGHAELVDPTSVEDIARGILHLLTEPPEKRATRIQQALEHTRRFQWQNAATEYIHLYQKILS